MTWATIELPSGPFSVRLPADLLDALHHFYPRSRVGANAPSARADFDIRDEVQSWTLHRDGQLIGSFSDSIDALLALEFEIESLVAKVTGPQIALHAGGVVTQQGAWLIAGHPDTGKTSTTFHLLELDQAFLCEEVALYEPATRRVLPHPQSLSVERGFLEDFVSTFPVTSGELVTFDDQVTRFLPRHVSDAGAVLDAVLLPRFRPGGPPAVELLSAESVLAEFLGYCFAPPESEEALYDAVIGLLEGTSIYRMTYPGARQARDLLTELLASRSTAGS